VETAAHNGPALQTGTSSVEREQTKMAASEDDKLKNKVSTMNSESDKEVEEELDESSNFGDRILQQLPISSTPATDRSVTNNQPEKQTSQLFGSKLPPIGKSNLPPLTLSLSTTDIPPITTSTVINPATSSTTSSSSVEVSSAVAVTNTEAPAARRESLVCQEGASDITKVVNNGEEGEGDDKESSHDGLVTVTPLNHTLSSELSGTLSDDSIAVTPTDSVDITESGMVCVHVHAGMCGVCVCLHACQYVLCVVCVHMWLCGQCMYMFIHICACVQCMCVGTCVHIYM